MYISTWVIADKHKIVIFDASLKMYGLLPNIRSLGKNVGVTPMEPEDKGIERNASFQNVWLQSVVTKELLLLKHHQQFFSDFLFHLKSVGCPVLI